MSTLVSAESSEAALAIISGDLEFLLDIISFQMHFAVRICHLEVLDFSEPVSVGDTRDVTIYPFPNGYSHAKFTKSQNLGNILAVECPILPPTAAHFSESTEAALRWYTKALGAPFDADQFAFLWIALEILANQQAKDQKRPYKAPCGHNIANCPECGKATQRRIGGDVMKRYLSDQLGVSSADAQILWNTRMMFHGANHLTPRSVDGIPRLNQVLMSATALAMKRALGLSEQSLPIVVAGAPAIGGFALSGSRQVTSHDLD